MKLEEKIFTDYIKDRKLKNSGVRNKILNVFLNTETHLTAEDLYNLVKKKYPSIGQATVYRSLKLFCQSGLCRELKFEDGVTRYEHLYGHKHHDHLVCTKCGKFIEIFDREIEKLQEKLFKQYGFHPQRHKMELYGVCKKCKK